jgi:5-methylcytosine-specific restriction protein B
MDQFTWIKIYKEIAAKLREYRDKQQELVSILTDMQKRGLPTISLMDKNAQGNQIPLSEIDPFTFFANFNRGIKTETRIEILKMLKDFWGLTSSIPGDFSGIPVVSNQQAWFIAYQKDRGEKDITLLWELFIQALDNNINEETFNAVLELKYVHYNITMGLFWIDPERYLNLDKVNRTYLAKNGIAISGLPDYQAYIACIEKTRNVLQKPFVQISHDAWLQGNEPDTPEEGSIVPRQSVKSWLFAPGPGGEHWNEFYSQGIMAIGWDHLGDLHQYKSKNDIAEAMREHDNEPESSKKNNATSCFSFSTEMQLGDHVFAKIGRNRIVGWGIITSEYMFDPSRPYYKHVRKVDWKAKGEWTVSEDNRFALKTVTDVTKYTDFAKYLHSLVGGQTTTTTKPSDIDVPITTTVQYWWLNANPKIWDMVAVPIGTRQTYTSHNAQGNKRRVYQYFKQIKPGDLVLGYVATPLRQIVASCKVTKGLHQTSEGEVFEFEKVEHFPEPVSFKELQSVAELKECEPLINNQGSLFKLKPDEYETIRGIIDAANESVAIKKKEPEYGIEECARTIGYSTDKIASWISAIERKKQAIFYGPPGTGKTFIATHLARHIVGGTDGAMDCIQFHPAYSYEEFIQGICPNADEKGNLQFDLKPGRFLEFCAKARQRTGPCVLIIDEINRANIARVFGELMYLLEYREKDMPLAGGIRFAIPDNVLVIGTMNTADRSIALVDFALRRRFAFLELSPEYDILKAFQEKRGFDAGGLVRALIEVNTKINDKNYYLGISFFMVDDLAKKLEEIWKMEIETYLEEYFFSQPEIMTNFRWDRMKGKILP